MKKFNKYFISIFALFLFVGVAHADFDISQWRFYKGVSGVNTSTSSLVGVELDREVFARANNNLSDIRIIDSNGVEVAYAVRSEVGKAQITSYSPRVLNLSSIPGEYTSFVADFGSNVVHNSLEMLTSSRNFRKNVQISGSDDNESWQVLEKDQVIYDYSLEFKAKDTVLKYPESSFRYLLVKIFDDGDDPIKVSGISAKKLELSKEKKVTYSPVYEFVIKNKKTFVLIDKGQKGLETDKIILGIGSENFERYADVYSSDKKGQWQENKNGFSKAGSGVLYSYKTSKLNANKFFIDYNKTQGRYILLEISNFDNDSIAFSSVKLEGVARSILFLASPSAHPLYSASWALNGCGACWLSLGAGLEF